MLERDPIARSEFLAAAGFFDAIELHETLLNRKLRLTARCHCPDQLEKLT